MARYYKKIEYTNFEDGFLRFYAVLSLFWPLLSLFWRVLQRFGNEFVRENTHDSPAETLAFAVGVI